MCVVIGYLTFFIQCEINVCPQVGAFGLRPLSVLLFINGLGPVTDSKTYYSINIQ